MSVGKVCYVIAGASKLALGAIIGTLLDNTENYIIVTTTSDRYKALNEVVITNNTSLSYPVLYVDESVTNLENLIEAMQKREVRVAVLSVKHGLFEKVTHSDDICTWFSACREGIFFYIPYLIQPGGAKKKIIAFDNDAEMVSKAQEMCDTTNVEVSKAMAHCVCSSAQLDEHREKILIEAGDECLLVFPPEAYYLRDEISRNAHIFSRRTVIYFTHTREEFRYWLLSKKLDINAIHTLLCACAYLSGHKRKMSIEETAKMRFDKIVDYNSVYPIISRAHRLLYELYLEPMADEYGDDLDLHVYRMKSFVDNLFCSQVETVQRGVDITSRGYEAKLADHIPLLKSAGDEEVNRILESFEGLL